jgi:hypothetical protein
MAVFAIFEALLSKNRKKQETFFVFKYTFLVKKLIPLK